MAFAQESWLLHMVQLSQQLARMHYMDIEIAVSLDSLQVHQSDQCQCAAVWRLLPLSMKDSSTAGMLALIYV